ncbi:MAG: hypothetical protein H7201_08000 [Candidatus Saccharibacteria bacterium]|nr:hypothetical protein [Microbacteriaceae bacterium]
MGAVTLLGAAAGILTTGAWLPQLVRCWQTRSAGDISWSYLLVLGIGVGMWAAYGCYTNDVVIVGANAMTMLALLTLAWFKITFRSTSEIGSALLPMGKQPADSE